MKSANHRHAVQEYEARQERIAETNRRLDDENRRHGHNGAHITPLGGLSRDQEAVHTEQPSSAAEEQMWEDYRRNPHASHFDAGDNPAAASLDVEKRLQEQVRGFGLWNARTTAHDLGFGVEDIEAELLQDQDHQFLSDLLADIG